MNVPSREAGFAAASAAMLRKACATALHLRIAVTIFSSRAAIVSGAK